MSGTSFSIVRALHRLDQGCGHRVPVPRPIHGDTFGQPTVMPIDAVETPFACPECGLVQLYSRLHIHSMSSETPCPYQAGKLVFVYIEAGCADSNCELRTKIHVVWDAATRSPVCEKPMSGWELDRRIKCVCGHSLSPLRDEQQFFRALMPF
jgi:hypothetical protein